MQEIKKNLTWIQASLSMHLPAVEYEQQEQKTEQEISSQVEEDSF